MIKTFAYILLCFILITSCGDQALPAPLAKDKMIDVLVDIRVLEGAYAAIVTKPDTLRPYMAANYDYVFAKHQVSHEQYLSAYNYYMARPEEMEVIEDSVINRISVRLNQLQSH